MSSWRLYFEEILKGQEAGGEDLRAVGQTPETRLRVLVWAGVWGEAKRPDSFLPTVSSFRSVSPCEHRPGMQCAVITPQPSYYPCPNLR